MSSRSCRGSPESHSIQHSGRPGCRCHWGFVTQIGTNEWIGSSARFVDWMVKLITSQLPSPQSMYASRPSLLRIATEGRFKIHAPPGKAVLVTQGIGVRSHRGYILLELWASSMTRLYLAHATGLRPPAFVRDRSGSGFSGRCTVIACDL